MAGRLVVSARVLVYINGRLYGKCTGFSWNSVTSRKEIRGIDQLYASEIVPTATGVQGSMSLIRTVGDGGSQDDGIVANQQYISKEKYFTIVLVEAATGLPIFRADMCSCTGESWELQAKDLMTGSVQFTGITWDNESSLRVIGKQ